MAIEFIKQVLRWLLLVFLQLTVFNNIGLYGLLNPFVYVFFLLYLPLGIPRSLLMLLGFATGLTIDIFSNTGGLHAMAATLLCYLRPIWVKIIIPRTNYDDLQSIKLREIEFGQFVTYSAVLIFVHHFSLYVVEAWRWNELGFSLLKAIFSSIITLFTVIAFRYFDFSSRSAS
jgi:rod shape-determining protein MreD